MQFVARNVNDMFEQLVQGIDTGGIPTTKEDSRNGPVKVISEPVTLQYNDPRERVLFNPFRDANPFFHMYEALWMLAGRNDVAPLSYYNSKMKDFSDDGKTFNAAYGFRWRHANHTTHQQVSDPDATSAEVWETSTDQLDILINHLRSNPTSRRAVLSMWNVEDDLLNIGGEVCRNSQHEAEDRGARFFAPCNDCKGTRQIPGSKDVACNLSACFSIRTEKDYATHGYAEEYKYLDMTVFNRSNDMIWGALGANYVHFSFLQEYVACCIGVNVGKYYQISNNLHVYDWNWRPEEWLAEEKNRDNFSPPRDYSQLGVRWQPMTMVLDQSTFDKEVCMIVQINQSFKHQDEYGVQIYEEPFLERVVYPMLMAYHEYKNKNRKESLKWCNLIEQKDWRTVAEAWIRRRM